MLSRFRWITFDVSGLLPSGWQQDVHELATAAADGAGLQIDEFFEKETKGG